MERVLARQLSTGAEFNRQRLPGSDSGSLSTPGAEHKCGMWSQSNARSGERNGLEMHCKKGQVGQKDRTTLTRFPVFPGAC